MFFRFNLEGMFFGVDISAYPDTMFSMIKDVAQVFKALGDETRLRIMALLVDGNELCVCDIMAALKLPQSTVSRHLSYLRSSGLVSDRRQGIWMYYQVKREDNKNIAKLFDMLAGMLAALDQVEEDQRCLREHLKQKKLQSCR
ncbi:MAG: metalloregulator ArsR/SmtB family transcription factor [Desulfobulbaceae bacterium]|nr:metalloregulator ArsR/SmtB family transcription factor [Desulfobulbaceae bacterium]